MPLQLNSIIEKLEKCQRFVGIQFNAWLRVLFASDRWGVMTEKRISQMRAFLYRIFKNNFDDNYD